MAAAVATERLVARRGVLFDFDSFRQRALDLLRRSKDPKRCVERMRVKVTDFLGQDFGEIKKDQVENEGAYASSYQENSAIQVKGLEEEMVVEKGDQIFGVTALQYEVRCFDLKEHQSAAVVQEIQEDLNAYRKGWKAELSFKIHANCCRMKGLMQLQGHLLSCANPGCIFLQLNTTHKFKFKKCITQRVKMKQREWFAQPANVLEYVGFQDGFEEVELQLAKQHAECSLVQQGKILFEGKVGKRVKPTRMKKCARLTVLLIEGSIASTSKEVLPATPGKESVVKKRRQAEDVSVEEMEHTSEAASFEEGRQI